MRGKLFGYVMSFVVIVLFSGFFAGKDDIYFEISKNIDLFGTVYKEISLNYVDEIDPEKFMEAGIKGMLNSLDPYTVFIDEEKKGDIELITNGKYGGVGISIGIRADKVTVVEVLDGYSAQKQGLRIGDILIEANGVKITPDNINIISTLVKGEPGTEVNLKVLRNGDHDTLSFNLIREEVILKNLTYYGFYPENSNNVYLKLTNFSRSADDEVRRALKELKEQKEIHSVILDLRGNPGGLLDVAVDIADKFIEKGQLIVTTKGRYPESKRDYFAKQEPLIGDAKLVILINEGSASASEIVAGAIQDHDRGVIVGTKSFGKGLVQTITPLNYNTSIKITTARYYTPSGRCIQKIDYSKDNDIFINVDSLITTPFSTDNNRLVYGSGGITPDSIVEYGNENGITADLLAKGYIFKFADYYYYQHLDSDFSSVKDEAVFDEFREFLKTNNYSYSSDEEKQLEFLIADAKKKSFNDAIIADLEKAKSHFSKNYTMHLNISREEIIKEIKSELASRYIGLEGKIEELLNHDPQFLTAINIVNNDTLYKRMLNNK